MPWGYVVAVTRPSKSQINKCGELVRQVRYEGLVVSPAELESAIRVITDFRAEHSYPLLKVRLGLSSMIRTERCDPVVSQRLKRVPRIVRNRIEQSVHQVGVRSWRGWKTLVEFVLSYRTGQNWTEYVDASSETGATSSNALVITSRYPKRLGIGRCTTSS